MKCYYDKCCITRLNTHSRIREHVLYPCVNECLPIINEKPGDLIISIDELRKALNRCIELDALCNDQPLSDPFACLTKEGSRKREFAELKDKWRNRLAHIIDSIELDWGK